MDPKELERAGLSPEQIQSVLGLMEKEQRDLNQRLERAQNQLADQQKRAAALREIRKFSPRDPEIALNLVDLGRVQMDEGGRLSGLDEQVQALRAQSGFLFQSPSPQGGGYAPQNRPDPTQNFDMNQFLRR